jgi:hypothetical protein
MKEEQERCANEGSKEKEAKERKQGKGSQGK